MKAIICKPDEFSAMFASSCEHPIPVRRADGSLFYAPCGKCSVCSSRKYARNSLRGHIGYLDCSQMWFITLTYSDMSLPILSYVENGDGDFIFTDDCPRSSAFGDSFAVDMNFQQYQDFLHFKKRQKSTWDIPWLAYPLKSDIQLFNKRLRYYLDKHGIKCKLLYRSEYGEAKKRPHWHLDLYLSVGQLSYSELFCYISKAWPYGITSLSLCTNSNSAGYVSSYCSTAQSDSPDSFLPLAYRTTIRSSNGLGKPSYYQSLYNFFTSSSAPEFPNFKISGSPLVIDSYPGYIQSTYFPRCYGFGYLPDETKIALYTIYSRLLSRYGTPSTKDLVILFRSDLLNLHDNNIDGFRSFIRLIFPEIATYHRIPYYYDDDGNLCQYDLDSPFFDDSSPIDKRLYSILLLSRRLYVHSNRFGISLTRYARRIMDYYSYLYDVNLSKQRYFYSLCNALETQLIFSDGYDKVVHPYSQRVFRYYDHRISLSKHSKYLTDIYLFND